MLLVAFYITFVRIFSALSLRVFQIKSQVLAVQRDDKTVQHVVPQQHVGVLSFAKDQQRCSG